VTGWDEEYKAGSPRNSELAKFGSLRAPVQVDVRARNGGAMCATKLIFAAGRIKERLAFSLLIAFVCLLLGGCGSVDLNRSPLLERGPVASADSRRTLPSAGEEFNQNLAALAYRDSIEPPEYAIGPQDLLEVSLFNVDATDGLPSKVQVRVSNQGFITLPVLGQVQVGGLTRTQLEETLRKGYGKFMHEPDVGVALAENRSKSVYVLGAVRNPGVFAITGQETLRRLLAMAGGLTKDAGMFVHLSRQVTDEGKAYVISLRDLANDRSGELNLPVRPGDSVNVPVAGTFYVDGYVEKPNAYPLVQPYTLTQALVLAGGLAPFAQSGSITVFRRGPKEEVEVLNHDLEKIRRGEEKDIQIAENDVIVVPPSMGRIVLSGLLGMVGYTSRSASYSWSVGRGGGVGRALSSP